MDELNNAPSDDEKKEKENAGEKAPSKGKGKRCAVLGAVAAIALLAGIAAGSIFGGADAPADGSAAIEQKAEPQPAADDEDADADDETVQQACEHDWTMTYKTVHHDAVTHTETVEPVYASKTSYHTVCNECQQTIDGIADQHIRDTGHSGYSTNVPITGEVLVSEGYSHEVTDTPAYDEAVADELVCAICGETKPVADAE